MTESPACVMEALVVAAARKEGPLAPALAEHAASCAICSEALMAVSFLMDAPEDEVPAAGLVYWKAELRMRRERTERALRPLRWAEAGSAGVLGALAVGAGVWSGTPLMAAGAIGFCAAMGGCWWVVARAKR